MTPYLGKDDLKTNTHREIDRESLRERERERQKKT